MRFIEVTFLASVALAHANSGINRVGRRHNGEDHGPDSTTVTTSTRYHTSTVYAAYPSDGVKVEDTKSYGDEKPGKVCKKKKHPVESAVPVYSDSGKSFVPIIDNIIKNLPKPADFLSGGKKDEKSAHPAKSAIASVVVEKPSSVIKVVSSSSAAPWAKPSGKKYGGKYDDDEDDDEEDEPKYGGKSEYWSAPAPSASAHVEPAYGAAPSEPAYGAAPSEPAYAAAPSAPAQAEASPSGGRGGGRGPRPSASPAVADPATPSQDPDLALNKPSGDWLQPAASSAAAPPEPQAAAPAPSEAPPAPSAAPAAAPAASSEEVVVVYQTVDVVPVQASAVPKRMRVVRR